MRDLLGGKGAGVAEMTRVLGPDLVPAGFTITTEACVEYMRAERLEPDGLDEQVADGARAARGSAGKRFGDDADPLLVSVRSGARESMPGMLDTILNLGLNDARWSGSRSATGNDRFAWDCYRRLVQMFGNVACGVAGERFEDAIAEAKGRGVDDRHRAAGRRPAGAGRARSRASTSFRRIRASSSRKRSARCSTRGPGDRAVQYRRINRIPDDWGTAVNVQQMVFGNKGETSATGVAFSRDEVTGAPTPSGDFLLNAQGEDVVSGVRTPLDLFELARRHAARRRDQLLEILRSSRRTTRTCRTPSSRSRRAGCTCSRRATPSARRRRRFASRWTRSTRACSLARQALATIDAGRARGPPAPDLRSRRRVHGARARRRRLAGSGHRADRVHRRRRGRGGRRGQAT